MIKYTKSFKYQLKENYTIQTDILGYEYNNQFIKLNENGWLLIRSGYAYDGASGPTKDDKTNMEGALVHDALYQLMRQEVIPRNFQEYSDKLFRDICLDKGMWRVRAWYYLKGLQMFGKSSNDPENKREVFIIE